MAQYFTMVGKHEASVKNSKKKQIVAFTLVDNQYQTRTVRTEDLAREVAANPQAFTNLGIVNGELTSTNGAIDRYATIDAETGRTVVNAATILNRVESKNKLVGYVAYISNKGLVEISVAKAAELASKSLVANGKVRPTEDGNIVSSIKGEYPIKEIEIKDAPKGTVDVTVKFVTSAIYEVKKAASETFGTKTKAKVIIENKELRYAGVLLTFSSAAYLAQARKVLEAENKAIINKYVEALKGKVPDEELAGDIEDLKMFEVQGTGVYGVFEYSTVQRFFSERANRDEKYDIFVSTLDYTDYKALIKSKKAAAKKAVEAAKKADDTYKGELAKTEDGKETKEIKALHADATAKRKTASALTKLVTLYERDVDRETQCIKVIKKDGTVEAFGPKRVTEKAEKVTDVIVKHVTSDFKF